MENLIYFASAHDGAIVFFPGNWHYFMKVCDGQGQGGVIDLVTGKLYHKADLEKWKYGTLCRITAKNLDEHYYQ